MDTSLISNSKNEELTQSSLDDSFGDFMAESEFSNRLRPATIKGYASVYHTFRRVMPEIQNPDQLSTGVITTFFRRLQERSRKIGKKMVITGIKNSTARGYCNRLNAFFKWLERRNHITNNPIQQLVLPEASYNDRRALEKDDIKKIIASVCLHSSSTLILKRDIAMIYILLFCGIRKGELKSLEIPDINFEKKIIAIKGKTSKSKITRYIPMNPTLILHLKDYIKERNDRKYNTVQLLVSSNQDSGLTEHGLKHWVAKLVANSRVKFHLHQFRHTFACNLANMNVNAVKIQKLMGHKDIRMTMTYLRSMTAEDLRGEIDNLDLDNFL